MTVPPELRSFPEQTLPHVLSRKMFKVSVAGVDDHHPTAVPRQARWAAFSSVVMPLVRDARDACMYEFGGKWVERSPHPAPVESMERGKVRLLAGEASFADDYWKFWADAEVKRGPVVWRARYCPDRAAEFFSKCADPVAVENPATFLTRSAVGFMKRSGERDDGTLVVGLPPGVGTVFIASSAAGIADLFRAALDHCRFSAQFIACYGKSPS